MSNKDSALSAISDGAKVAIGIGMTLKISPAIGEVVSVFWLADFIGLLVSVSLVSLFSTKVLGWPRLEAVWYRENGLRRISGSALIWEKRQQVKKVEVHIKVETPSVLSRVYFRYFLKSIAVVRITAGQDNLLVATIEEAPPQYRADSSEGEVEIRLVRSDKHAYEAWLSFSWQTRGVRPQAATSRNIRVRLGDISKRKVWPIDADSNIRSIELAA